MTPRYRRGLYPCGRPPRAARSATLSGVTSGEVRAGDGEWISDPLECEARRLLLPLARGDLGEERQGVEALRRH